MERNGFTTLSAARTWWPSAPGDANQSGPSEQSGKPEDKNVQDASYEVVDEEKDKDKKK